MPLKNHKKSKTNKNHKRPSHKSPKRSPSRRIDVVNDNPVSPSLGDPNAFNFLLEKHTSAVEVFMNFNLILSSYSHMLSS